MVTERHHLKFQLPEAAQQAAANLSIFSSSLDRVFSGEVPVINFRPSETGLEWNGLDDDGRMIGTGIFFFIINVDNKQYTGKFSAIRN
jgi:hypothetical protein